ncbi:MAG: alpha/beta fold hydrolase [Anaerolineales bacterium]
MPDLSDTALIQFNGWTLRVRQAAVRPARLLLLLHGYTGDENSMWVFAKDLPRYYWMVAPRAPHPAEMRGYSWRPLQPGTFGRPSLEELIPQAEALIRLVDAYQASAGIEAPDFDVMGFSQGGAMSNVLAFLYPQRIRKMGILAGFVPSGLDVYARNHPLEGKRVFVTHGTRDDMVPIDRARASVAVLEQAGAQIVYCEDEVGHKVSLNCLRALRSYLED